MNRIQRFYSLIAAWVLIVCAVSADAVPDSRVVSSDMTVHVLKNGELEVTEHTRVLIARKSDRYLGHERFFTHPFCELESIDAAVYDTSGQELERLDEDQIKSSSAFVDVLSQDRRVVYYELEHLKPPYIVSHKKRYRLGSWLFWSTWSPRRSVPVERACLTIQSEDSLTGTWSVSGLESIAPRKTEDLFQWQWTVTDLAALEDEYMQKPGSGTGVWVDYQPEIMDLAGVRRVVYSWADLGAWYQQLTEAAFPEPVRSGAVRSSPSDSALIPEIRTRYRQLQRQYRYVQHYKGLAELIPHPVHETLQLGYGDCKDLSFCFAATLRQAGIPAFPVLIRTTNAGFIDPDRPSMDFNHCIVCVPAGADTLWVECTSDVCRVDDPPDVIEGVHALVIDGMRSRLIRTPESTSDDNRMRLNGRLDLRADRTARLSVRVSYQGNLADRMRMRIQATPKADRETWWLRQVTRSETFESALVTFDALADPERELVVEGVCEIANFGRRAGSRWLFQPRLVTRTSFDGESPEDRQTPLWNPTPYVRQDSLVITWPQPYQLVSPAHADTLSSPFGRCWCQLHRSADSLVLVSGVENRIRSVSVEDYADYYDHMKAVESRTHQYLYLRR